MNNDIISRSALKRALEVTQYNDIDDLTRTERLIDNAPTVDVIPNAEGYKMYNKGYAQGYERGKAEKRPTGEWITIGEEQGALRIIYKIRKCSKCGWEHSLFIPDNYCPNCGADMRGEK